jgi:hypothetical protein
MCKQKQERQCCALIVQVVLVCGAAASLTVGIVTSASLSSRTLTYVTCHALRT